MILQDGLSGFVVGRAENAAPTLGYHRNEFDILSRLSSLGQAHC